MGVWHNACWEINNCYQDYGVRSAADLQRLLMEEGVTELRK
jgi:hypothetical protein